MNRRTSDNGWWAPWSAAILLLTCAGPAALAVIPGADDPKAYTYHQFIKGERDYNRRQLVEAYRSVGNRNPKWDDDAVAALEALAEAFARANMEPIYFGGVKADNDRRDVLAAAEKAVALGCDDPMLLYAHGAMLDDLGRNDEAKAVLIRAAKGLEGSGYPPVRKASAALRLASLYNARRAQDQGELARLNGLAAKWLVAGVSKDAIGNDQRHAYDALAGAIPDLPVALQAEVAQKLEADPASDPWMALMIRGVHHKRAGWAARGGGFANTVTPQGWKTFFEELRKARTFLVKAHEMRPDWPEAAAEMIAVAMGGGDDLGESTRAWFDKAVKAQLDYRQAYTNYVWSIFPRWGGSHLKMFEFGRECARTGRFDTAVPFHLLVVLERINNDLDRDFTFYSLPPVYAAIEDLFAQLERNAPPGVDLSWYRSYHLALAWRARRFDDAARVVRKLDRPDFRPFEKVRGWAAGALSEVHAMGSAHGATLTEAEKSVEDRDYAKAGEAYKQVLDAMANDDAGRLFVRYRARQLAIEDVYRTGKPVNLTPTADFAPWIVVDGKWSRSDNGDLTLTTEQMARNRLLCKVDLGPRHEMGVTIDWPDEKKPAIGAVYVSTGDSVAYVSFEKPTGQIAIVSPRGRRTWNGQFPQKIMVLFRRKDSAIDVIVNTRPLIENYDLRLAGGTKDVYAGIGSPTHEPGRVVRFNLIGAKALPEEE